MKHTLIVLVFTLFISCVNSDNELIEIIDFAVENELEIIDYIETNNLIAQRSDTGLYYVINEEGNGEQPTSTSNVTVVYKGYFVNDNVFDQSDSDGITIGLNQVIQGWTEGIAYFKEGGNGMLLVPSHLAYGNSGNGSIPPGAVLIFDIELLSVN